MRRPGSMIGARRIARLERGLSPRDAALLCLETARRHRNLGDYGKSILAAGSNADRPQRRIRELLGPRSKQGRSADDERRRVHEGLVIFWIALGLDVAACELAQKVIPQAAALMMSRSQSDPDFAGFWTGEGHGGGPDLEMPLDPSWTAWRAMVEQTVRDVRVEKQARRLLERRYFGGDGVLFPDTADAWERVEEAEASLALLLRTRAGLGPGASMPHRRLSDHAAQHRALASLRADKIVSEATTSALTVMGEQEEALAMETDSLRADD